MQCCMRVSNLIQKPKIDLHNWKLILKRGLKLSSSVLPNVSHNNHLNKCKLIQPNTQLEINPSSFSTTVAAQGHSDGPAQEKEKRKNMLTLAGVVLIVFTTIVLQLSLEYRHDYVYTELPENPGKKK